jgi:hypothetical protein
MLLAPAPQNPFRVVGKRGISIEGGYFAAPELAEFAGQRVRVFYDPSDMGRITVFTANDPREFICTATNLERLGVAERQELACVMKKRLGSFVSRERLRLSKIAREVKPHSVLDEVLDHAAASGTAPPTGEMLAKDFAHTTAALAASKVASDALRSAPTPEPDYAVEAVPMKDEGDQRWEKFGRLRHLPPKSLSAEDRLFLRIYPVSPGCIARIKLGKTAS